MAVLDWIVIGVYAFSMLAIGEYYSRQNTSADDYLLGGRKMNPLAVGLSLFSTLVSTLSYLSWPSEMIGHGPMMFLAILSYPFIFWVVGWGLIPYIMRQPVTSAYELLESRLGLGARLTGAAIFLLLRLAWMAAILYATSANVIVPLLGIDAKANWWWIPLLCAVLGLITVIYSSAGGIKAVVVTDALQSLTMIAGGVVTLVFVSVHLGGISAWWPQRWLAHWDPPTFGIDMNARVPLPALLLSTAGWYICTAGSDQMAIQRYLSTRDSRAARQTLFTSMCCDVLVSILLGLTGLAVLGYFKLHPEQMPTGKSLLQSADLLFPHFIMVGLPAGLTGLVFAALLAAAMSSLSSGINSTCAVLARDFINRRDDGLGTDSGSVRQMQRLSWVMGAASVLLSLVVSQVEGNLVELCYKVVNLLTAPLFVLFFMAMFVPWATKAGSYLGVAASIAVALVIAFVKGIGISFLWITPVSLAVGIGVGCGLCALEQMLRPPSPESSKDSSAAKGRMVSPPLEGGAGGVSGKDS